MQLVKMVEEDGQLESINTSNSHFGIANGSQLSDERREQYLAVTKKIKARYVFISRRNGEIRQIDIRRSLSEYKLDNEKISESEKGYRWKPCKKCSEHESENNRSKVLDKDIWIRCYASCELRPDNMRLSSNIDDANEYTNMDSTEYRHIEDDWYLYVNASRDTGV